MIAEVLRCTSDTLSPRSCSTRRRNSGRIVKRPSTFLIEKVIMSDSTALCGVCCLRHLSKPSTGWCLECEEGLCVDCKEHHSLLKATRNHNILPITEYQKLPQNVLEITQNCGKHNEIVQIVCIKHDCPCCRKCIIETHNNCKDLIEIEDYIKDVKSSTRFNELEEMLNETAENIKRIRINRQENLTSLQEERIRIENDIAQTRIKINNHLDILQADLIQNLYAKAMKENEKIQQVLKSLDEKQCQIKEYQNTFETIKKYAKDVQLFLFMKLMETNMVTNEKFIQSLMESESLCQVMLVFKDTIDTETITASMPYIGKVGVDYSPSQVSIMKKKEKQAQMMANKATTKSIGKIALKVQKKITACGKGVTGCTLLPHGKMAFANEMERNVKIVKSEGSLDFNIDLKPYTPFDITYIPSTNTIAVTSSSSNDIKVVDVNTKRVLKTYCLDSPCAGISYSEKRLILCSTEKGILELNQLDGSVKTIISVEMDNFTHVAVLGDKIYYTHSNNNSVVCYDFRGKIQWTFQNREITYPFGVTVDIGGNVFVAGNNSPHNVVVVSPDGQQHKQLLSSKDDIEWPNGLIYDRHKNQLLVTNYDKGAVLYNVT
ncbi:unnamed protein product [Mytilus coruscus]|uniref:B box-type domain-containing protein n=1 Tax=Mytilus coruscus TaxID=42192 RepID=A0A6J8ERD6_MYTCO|nr:unnamed protein product [Mytilus coruscus]